MLLFALALLLDALPELGLLLFALALLLDVFPELGLLLFALALLLDVLPELGLLLFALALLLDVLPELGLLFELLVDVELLFGLLVPELLVEVFGLLGAALSPLLLPNPPSTLEDWFELDDVFPGFFVVFELLLLGLLTVFPLGLLFPVLVVTGGFLPTMVLLELDDDEPELPVITLPELGLFDVLPDEDDVPPGLLELVDPPKGFLFVEDDDVPPGLFEVLAPPTGLLLVVPLGLLELLLLELLLDPDGLGLSVEVVGFLIGGFLNEGSLNFNA
ncbi:hypothetical protein RATSFB_1152 [Candidatus Arthromitus sp. SFB-rat-Yit]|nr:hypothetical protein RATSFB_1152 [Candidatus Arthromitus sp. SFB-rat-Yit]